MLADVIQINISNKNSALVACNSYGHAFIISSGQKGSSRHFDKASLLYLNLL